MTALRIFEADLADGEHAEGLLAVLDAYALEPVIGGRPLPADVRSRLVEGLRAHPTSRVWLATEGARAVGAAVVFEGYSTFAARPLLNIHDLAVVADRQGAGIGRALLAAVEAAARERGCAKLTLETTEDNTPARGLYASFGFGAYAPGQTPKTTLFLEKRLDPPG